LQYPAGEAGQFGAGTPGIVANEAADAGDVVVTEIATTVAMTHELS
jgi:hypothetical protein